MPFNTTPDSYTKLLIHSDTSDTSTTFVDSSATGHIITATGGASHSIDESKFGATSMYFDGASSGDYLAIPATTDVEITGDFTFDCWFKKNQASVPSEEYFISNMAATVGFYIYLQTNNRIYLGHRVSSTEQYVGFDFSTDVNWHHLASVRASGEWMFFLDGVKQTIVYNDLAGARDTLALGTSTEAIWIGSATTSSTRSWDGYMDEIRLSNIARWTENFTPPSRPYSIIDDQFHTDIDTISDREIVVGEPIDSYTKLLIHSDDIDEGTTIVDSSPDNRSITVSGSVNHATAQKKLGNSGIYYNASGLNYLSVNVGDFGTDLWTFDLWIYHTAASFTVTYNEFFSFLTNAAGSVDTGVQFLTDNRAGLGHKIDWWSGILRSTSDMIVDTWHHIACTRSNSTTLNLFIDGVLEDTYTCDSSLEINFSSLKIGSDGGAEYLKGGYMDEIRISKGIARWTTDFVPPKRMYGEKTVISAEGGVGIGTNIAREAFHVNSGQRRLYTVTADADGSLFSVNDKNGNVLLDVDNEGWVTKPKLPAFLAQPASQQNDIAVGGSHTTVVWGTVRFDQGNNFASNTFTAPVTGKYMFTFNIAWLNIDSAASYYQVGLEASGYDFEHEFDPDFGQDNVSFLCASSILVDMDANDTCYVRVKQPDGTQQSDIGVASYFSGYLVC